MRASAILILPALLLTGCDAADVLDVEPDLRNERADEVSRNDAPSIVGIASTSEDFETLTAAVIAAGLAEVLDGPGQFTVFAPTDEAFAALGLDEAAVQALPTDALTDILLLHVTRGTRRSQSVLGAGRLKMLNGDWITVNGLTVDAPGSSAQLVPSLIDINASNGTVHVVDAVLLP